MKEFLRELFSSKGRWNRKKYWLYPLVAAIPFVLYCTIIASYISYVGYSEQGLYGQQIDIENAMDQLMLSGEENNISEEEVKSSQEYSDLANELSAVNAQIDQYIVEIDRSKNVTSTLLYLIFAIMYFIILYINVVTYIKRLHDLDKSGWYFLLTLIPIVNLFIIIPCSFFKGTDGPNQYGPDPLKS